MFVFNHHTRVAVTIHYRHIKVGSRMVKLHLLRAERALGKPLPKGAEVHHADGSKGDNAPLVICQSRAYHKLLHARMRLVRLGCNPNTERFCPWCREIKPITDMLRNICKSCNRWNCAFRTRRNRRGSQAVSRCLESQTNRSSQ
jgi:hypothetical protein